MDSSSRNLRKSTHQFPRLLSLSLSLPALFSPIIFYFGEEFSSAVSASTVNWRQTESAAGNFPLLLHFLRIVSVLACIFVAAGAAAYCAELIDRWPELCLTCMMYRLCCSWFFVFNIFEPGCRVCLKALGLWLSLVMLLQTSNYSG